MPAPPPTPNHHLPSSHPLILELASLRQQLAQYQRAAHTTGIQLQGARLEAALSQEEAEGKGKINEGLRKEIEVLRANPALPPIPPTSTALTELSLAHRRLSSKLDLTEAQLASTRLELAAAQQEVQRLIREKESDRAVLNELRRVEEDREEEIEWERSERREAEEQKKLCDLALQEYQELVKSLDPSAVPPPLPTPSSSKATSPFFSTPSINSVLSPKLDGEPSSEATPASADPIPTPPPTALSPSETISNLLIGQRGVHALFTDFSSALTTKERTIHALQTKIDSLESSLGTLTDQLAAETTSRVEAEGERDKALRDDASAARVVERYMTFTQKTHATVHMHLGNLRTRSQATAASLRSEVASLRARLAAERARADKLRVALDELSEGMSREAAGRRREVALRLKMISNEEKRGRKVEAWLNKVRRMREGVEGVVLEADVLESLVDEGIEAVEDKGGEGDVGKDKQRSWRGLGGLGMLGKKKKDAEDGSEERNPEEEALARTLLAEELVTTLVQDLQAETERRMELERQRVEWLAKEAAEGVKAEEDEGEGHVMFDAEDNDEGQAHGAEDGNQADEEDVEANPETPLKEKELPAEPSTPPVAEPSPLVGQLHELFAPLTARYEPLQKTLHDLSLSLSALRTSLPSLEDPNPSSPTTKSKKSTFLPLSLAPPRPSADPTLLALLDALHEVIEDDRVDVEIALADHERVLRGFEALLNVGAKGERKDDVMSEVREYVEVKGDEGAEWKRLSGKVQDVESDLAGLKMVVHEMEGMEVAHEEAETEAEAGKGKGKSRKRSKSSASVWHGVTLKTVSVHARQPSPIPSPLISPALDDLHSPHGPLGNGNGDAEPRRRTTSMFSSVGNVGRSFSAGVMGAPRRVSGLASGMYRAPTPTGAKGKENGNKIDEVEDDVE
ncbi:hypothetical protein IAT38_008054 [Cryptococcus sp. DSM 104549]